MYDHIIKYTKWDKKENKIFLNSSKKYLHLNDIQIYFPILSLYFYYHNTKNANKIIDLNRKYKVLEIIDSIEYKYYNSNKLCKCKILDTNLKININVELFCKCIHILDPLHMMMNNYNLNNTSLPNNYTYNAQSKINDIHNTAYIDIFFSYLMSELTIKNILPNFPIFYGSINGIIDEYKFDITEEYPEFINEKWFNKNIGDIFTIDMFVSNGESGESDTRSDTSNTSDSDIDSCSIDDDFICKLKNFPVQYMFLEKLGGTLEDFLVGDINAELLKSCLFQIIFALAYLQKHYKFTHNDLHINNIMYQSTNITHLYYKYNNTYFKIPTCGYIFKIIDFGRSIFTLKNKTFFNDVYSKYGEAEGQYHYPIPNVPLYEKDRYELDIKPNYSFDMCRLSTTILDEIDNTNLELYQFLNDIVIDKDGNNIFEDMTDSFDLYIDIAKNAVNGIPHILLQKDIFKIYRTKKRLFPRKEYYSMD